MDKTLKKIDLNLISGLILNFLVLIIGVIVMIFKSFGLIDIVLYISILFYIYALFSTISYFVKRKEGDYELLLLSLINIIVATFMFIFKNDNAPMILGSGLTIYTTLIILNRICKIIYLKNNNSFMWIIKSIITFLIAFLGILTIFNLFNEVTVQTMMFGFYFISLGFMLLIENLIEMFITDSAFKKILAKLLTEENGKFEEIKEDNVVTKGRTKNISEVAKEVSDKPKKISEVAKKVTDKPKKVVKKKVVEKEENKKVAKKVGRPKKTEIKVANRKSSK